MPDSAAKRIREAKKRRHREVKADRKRMRKEGLLVGDPNALFAPGEKPREVISSSPAKPESAAVEPEGAADPDSDPA